MTPAAPERFLDDSQLPLRGIKVVELSHMIMGPAAGLVLADLGAEVIKVEPVEGDRTRGLQGAGSGFFPLFNRNKQSLAVDLKSAEGRAIVQKLARQADMLVENFRDDSLVQYGLDFATLSAANPRLIYVSLKGFLSGPYKRRTALDEVVQMMGGLAYINGGANTPQRVPSSVNDILGGTFAAVGALAALNQRHLTGKGTHVRSGLFENNLLLVAQFIAQYQLTGTAMKPVGAERKPAWGIYDIFDTADGGREDPHLTEGGALLPTTLSDGKTLSSAALPIEFDGRKTGMRNQPPAIGAHTLSILQGLGMTESQIAGLQQAGIIRN
jgi:crotonobetainyl-CoA:carnitine CoA-transferase CaiB-like acyl-CoA transferase